MLYQEKERKLNGVSSTPLFRALTHCAMSLLALGEGIEQTAQFAEVAYGSRTSPFRGRCGVVHNGHADRIVVWQVQDPVPGMPRVVYATGQATEMGSVGSVVSERERRHEDR